MTDILDAAKIGFLFFPLSVIISVNTMIAEYGRAGTTPADASTYDTAILKRRKLMFRLWAKIFRDNHMLRDTVICNDKTDTRTHKVFDALQDVCMQFDLGGPLWLDSNIRDFRRHSKTRFTQDSFIEQIDFDFLEIHVIEED